MLSSVCAVSKVDLFGSRLVGVDAVRLERLEPTTFVTYERHPMGSLSTNPGAIGQLIKVTTSSAGSDYFSKAKPGCSTVLHSLL